MNPIQWTHSPWSRNPLRALLVLAILLIVASLVVWWLGPRVESAILLIAFVFSLRDSILPLSFSIDEDGLHQSSPLRGAKSIYWEDMREWRVDGMRLKAFPERGKPFDWPLAPAPDLEDLQARIEELQAFHSELHGN